MNEWRHVSTINGLQCIACPEHWPCDAERMRLRAERAEKPLHRDPEDQDRCDGHCAADECVCPEGGWQAEAERWQARAERAEADR